MRTFYVIQPPPDDITTLCVDIVRVLANPTTTRRAHITVRGPYPEPLPEGSLPDVNGLGVVVIGLGKFWEKPEQNTVYLKVVSAGLKEVWHKPDYPDEYNPHLSLYDGPSRQFAEYLYGTVTLFAPLLRFKASKLEPLIKTSEPRPPLAQTLDVRPFEELIGEKFPLHAVLEHCNTPSDSERASLIRMVLRKLYESKAPGRFR